MLISMIVPTWKRPEQLKRMLDSLYATTPTGAYELMVYPEEAHSPVPKWNQGAAEAIGDWLFLGADDLIFQPGWYEAAVANSDAGFVGVNDLAYPPPYKGDYAPHYMVSREFCIECMGGVLAPPMYYNWWFDREVAARAHRAGRYRWVEECRVEHLHPDFHKAEMDATYERSWPYHDVDHHLYDVRKTMGFPDDFPAVVRQLEAVYE